MSKENIAPERVIALNSFVRRTDRTDILKDLIRQFDGELSRKGRSRNWSLRISPQKVFALRNRIQDAGEPSWLWVSKLLSHQCTPYTEEQLTTIARQHWPITVTKLIELTDCTQARARIVIDKIEWCGNHRMW